MNRDDVTIALDDTDVMYRLTAAAAFKSVSDSVNAAFDTEVTAVKQLLGPATIGTVNGLIVVTHKWESRRVTDYDGLKAAHPKIYTKFVSESSYQKINRSPGKRKRG